MKQKRRSNIANRISLAILCLLVCAAVCGHAQVTLRTPDDTLSWVVGESYAKAFLNTPFKLDNDIMVQAFAHTLAGGEQPIDDETYQSIMKYFTISNYRYHQQLTQQRTEQSAKDEAAHIAQLQKENPNIVKSDKGFYYEVLTEGTGKKVEYNKRASFDYRGFALLTGEPIDQTYGRREPILTVINEHIFPGLNDGLQLMREGSKYRFYFPNSVAFGAEGSNNVPPFTGLIYEVEVHSVFDD